MCLNHARPNMEEGEKERAIYLGAADSLAFPPLPPISSSCQKILLYYSARTDRPSLSLLRRCHIIQKNKSAIKWGGGERRASLIWKFIQPPSSPWGKKVLFPNLSLSFPSNGKQGILFSSFFFVPLPLPFLLSIHRYSFFFLSRLWGKRRTKGGMSPLLYSAGSERTGKGFTYNLQDKRLQTEVLLF